MTARRAVPPYMYVPGGSSPPELGRSSGVDEVVAEGFCSVMLPSPGAIVGRVSPEDNVPPIEVVIVTGGTVSAGCSNCEDT